MFKFYAAKYQNTRRGVRTTGKVSYNGKNVGLFKQEPGGACVANLDEIHHPLFIQMAVARNLHECDYAELLLQEAEDLFMAGK